MKDIDKCLARYQGVRLYCAEVSEGSLNLSNFSSSFRLILVAEHLKAFQKGEVMLEPQEISEREAGDKDLSRLMFCRTIFSLNTRRLPFQDNG